MSLGRMATSACAGIARKSLRLRNVSTASSCFRGSRGSIFGSGASGTRSYTEGDCGRRWASATVLSDKQRTEHWKSVKLALGAFSGVGIAVLGFQIAQEDSALCDATELQKATPEEIEKSPLIASKKYNLLADSYRRQVFFNYERRIRARSRPEKVFSYFASQRNSNGQPFMTPNDLMRAVVPIFPSNESTVIRVGHLKGERSPGEFSYAPSEFFMLFDMNGDGLISFSEYNFFVTLLSIPVKSFQIAFKMFDLDGNGLIDRDEFKEVMRRLKERTQQGLAQQNAYSGFAVSTSVENSGLVEYFFGKDGKQQLRHEDFEKFLRQLHEEIIWLEFAHYDFRQQGTISAHDFALSMIAAADMDLLSEYLDRADPLLKNPHFKKMRISREEFQKFAELRKKLQKLARAMSSCGSLNKEDFQRAASQVCNIPLSNAVVDIVFQIFDTNQDGHLSGEEFLHAMERRENGIANPKETGLVYLFKCWWRCAQSCQSLQGTWKV